MPKTLFDLLTALARPQIAGTHGDLTVPITAPVVESDVDVEPGGLFVARRGLAVDGHDFIPAAIERGAAAIVGEHDLRDLPVPYIRVKDAQEATGWLSAAYHDFPARRLIVIGVTGTDGKTTTSILVHSMLQQATGKAGLISTVNADLGDAVADTGLHVTTPSAPQVQALLARMVTNGLTYAVIEMTSHGLAQGRLNGVDVDVAILTNIRHEHLDFHGSFENYRAAKGRLFQMLAKSHRKNKQPKISVINTDDPNGDSFAEFAADRVIRYGLTENAEYRAVDINYTPEGTTFRVEYPDDFVFGTTKSDTEFFTPLLGVFNVYNALAAVETCIALPVSIRAITEGLRQVEVISGRMERIDEGQEFTAIVDFAHTPNALENALTTCRQMLPEGKKLIAVFG
ncbi:MAG: UDP-N-acetylmuramoyl-L-alanyl-D-glutamate--2,6-diaminopimelate ligase, partial [Anaerolineae bacterium]|nr:UDP-N-acetylmuramoyl-L-alanyl-D-glutamate--2,6-diaminopimelate ligase [Anaerolineae bacterium]